MWRWIDGSRGTAWLSLLAAVSVVLASALLGGAPAAAEWQPPVDAPIVDPFRPPASRYGAGNRGLEYGISGDQIVRAVDAGTVVFAGRVGGSAHITIDHGEGLRSTSAFVSRIDVVRGQRVRQGQVIGAAGPGFHLTARLGDTYVDPALLFAGYEVSLRLTESDLPSAIGRSSVDRSGWDPLLATAAAADDLRLSNQLVSAAEAASAWFHFDCTDDGVDVGGAPASGRVLIEVGGLGSSSVDASIEDLDEVRLGYDADDVVRFSYAGLCPDELAAERSAGAPLEGSLIQEPYVGHDTHQDVEVSAMHLVALVEEAHRLRPGQPIDIAAHSLGGVVTRRALEILAERGGPLPSVVITIGSPHQGASLATAAQVASGTAVGDLVADTAGADLASADSVAQIAEGGVAHLEPPNAPPEGVTVVAVAGSTDLVVPADAATWSGATNVIVPTVGSGGDAHSALPGTWQVERELALAVTGSPPRCVGLGDALIAAGTSTLISGVQDSATVIVGAGRWLL